MKKRKGPRQVIIVGNRCPGCGKATRRTGLCLRCQSTSGPGEGPHLRPGGR